MPSLQERIKEMRLSCGLTLLQVANKLGIKEATMQRYESGGIRNIKHETIVALAEIFGCTPSYLMGWTDEINEPDIVVHPPITVHEKALVEAYRDHPSMQPAVDRLLGLPLRDGRSSQTDTGMAEYAAQGVAPSAIPEMDAATFRAAEEARLQKQADRLMAQRDRLNKTKFRRKK